MELVRRGLLDVLSPIVRREQVVVVTGARQTGKTTLCEVQIPQSLNLPSTYITFDDPDERLRFQRDAVSILESFETPIVVLDEVQKIPSLFDPLKLVVDRKHMGKGPAGVVFVLTGSSQFLLLHRVRESLAGRVAHFHLYPFSLNESAGSPGQPYLSRIWAEKRLSRDDAKRFHSLRPEVSRRLQQTAESHRRWGGYPPVWHRKDPADKLRWLKDYRKTYLERDIADVGQVSNLDTFALAQKLMFARTANILSYSEIARDLGLTVNTVKRYLNLLTMSFQCFLLPPFFENVGKRFIKSPKIHSGDPGVSRAVLGEMSVPDGALYESWVFCELVKWKELQKVEPSLFHYRTAAGLEIDFLLVGNGIILPVEAKSRSRVTHADGRKLELFLKDHSSAAPFGLVVYPGKELAEIRKGVWAVPDWYLFGSG